MASAVACFGCSRYPHLRVRDLQFSNGVLEVFSLKDAELIRGCDDYRGGAIRELTPGEPNDVEPVQQGNRARIGMRSASDPSTLPDENEPSVVPEPETDTPDSAFPEAKWPQDSVLAKPGGWYEYQGKNYRKADLPDAAKRLI